MKSDVPPKKIIFLLSIVLATWFNMPYYATAQDLAQDKANFETKNKPDVWLSPEEDLDSQIRGDKQGWFSKNKWWVLLGGIVIAGLSGITASNNDDGGDEDSGNGNYIGSW